MNQFLAPNDLAAERRAAFENGEVPVAVYGLGKMGLRSPPCTLRSPAT